MHAALLNLTIDPDQAPVAADALTHDILPAIRSAPGFVAGYWLEPVDGHGLSFVVFETEEQARRSASPASNWAAAGVSINDVDFRQVEDLSMSHDAFQSVDSVKYLTARVRAAAGSARDLRRDRRAEIHEAFLALGRCLVCFRRLRRSF